ncbi:developmental regulator, ULTRAPETALA [Actinidia rufa]|uniref:Developmental regulator, ULTRAPETALA n=1 Tax=Actinidia rufa TaxID=165716 RepID=A0A7J0FK39_9ERIC|nr:developmental regulator, ULTRAPETALA [Actinidia rufa]
MENGVERASDAAAAAMFGEEEVREISGFTRGHDYVEVMCGCTSYRYGDAVGRLRVFVSGDLEICCECTPGCPEVQVYDESSLSTT